MGHKIFTPSHSNKNLFFEDPPQKFFCPPKKLLYFFNLARLGQYTKKALAWLGSCKNRLVPTLLRLSNLAWKTLNQVTDMALNFERLKNCVRLTSSKSHKSPSIYLQIKYAEAAF